MTEKTKIQVVFAAILAETSPQALPLGAACVASAVRNAKLKNIQTALCDISYDEAKELKKMLPNLFQKKCLKLQKSECFFLVVSFSFCMEYLNCVRAAEIIKQKK